MAKIEILESEEGKFYFLLKSRNGVKLLWGEPLASVAECEEAIKEVRELAKDMANFRFCKTQFCEPYFTIGNGHTVATSRCYDSVANRRGSIKPIRTNLAQAVIIYPEGQ